MDLLPVILLKCRKIFIFVLIFSIINPSISLGMNEEAEFYHTISNQLKERVVPEKEQKDQDNQLRLISENEQEDQELNNNISKNYVSAFRSDDKEEGSRFLIFKRITGLLTGIIVCIPQIDVALGAGKYYGSKELGYGLVVLTFLAQGGIASWITSEFIDDTYELVQKVKAQKSRCCSLNTLKELKFGLLSFIVGVLSSSSDVYKVYHYNKIKGLAIITFIFDAVTRTLGLYKTFNSLKTSITNHSSQEQNLIRKKGEEYINSSKRNFLNICKRYGIDNISEALDNFTKPNEVYNYITLDSDQESFSRVSNNYTKGFSRKIVMGLSLIFPISSAIFDAVMAYKGYNLFIKNSVGAGVLTGLSVLPTSALGLYVITKASDSIFYNLSLSRKGFKNPEYFSIFKPGVNRAFFVTSLLLGGLSSLAGFAIIADNMKDTIFSPIKYVVATVGVASGLIFGTYTILSTIKDYGEEVVKKCNKGASYIFGCLKKLSKISSSIFTSNVNTVSEFTDQISTEDNI